MTYTNLYIGSNGYVAAIEPESGRELWRTQLATGIVFSDMSYQDVTVLDHGSLVFAGCNGHTFCLSTDDGCVLWHNELPGMGHNDVTLAIGGRSAQAVGKPRRSD